MIDHYYAPTADGGKELPHSVTSCEHTFFSTGPAETIEIDSDHMAVTVVHDGRTRDLTYLSIGPSVFPVIPIFPVNWFMSDGNHHLTLKFNVNIKNKAGIIWHVNETVIVLPDNSRVRPMMYYGSVYQGYDTKAYSPVGDTIVELKSSSAHFELRYPLTAKNVSAFQLSLEGFSTDDVPIALPRIAFQAASSWKMCGAP